MNQTITVKIQLKVSPSEYQLFLDTMKSYSAACNCVSDYIYKTHDLKQRSIHRALYSILRDEYNLGAQMACSVFITVLARYKTIKTNQNKWIKPVFNRPQVDLVWNRDYSLLKTKSLFSVNTLSGRIKCQFYDHGLSEYMTDDYKFGTAKLVCSRNKIYLHIPVSYEINELKLSDVSNIVGIDRGIRFIVTTYDSKNKTKFYSGRQIKQKRAHYKALRKQLQQAKTASSRRRLKSIGQRENRWMQDVNHCISKALVDSNPDGTLFVLEDLSGVRSATESVKVRDRYVMVSWSYYDLEQKLEHKALKNHQSVIKVNPRYTSQCCPRCGHTEHANRNKVIHLFCCKNCGYKSNDDRIGAMNLYRKGIDYIHDTVTTE